MMNDYRHQMTPAMRALRGAIVIVLALALPVPVLAADFEVGKEAYDRGDYATALVEWLPLAEQGDPDAQYSLGVLYKNGQGVTQNLTTSMKWFRVAAAQVHDGAQFNVGLMYEYGFGVVALDYAEAMKWYRLAAEQEQAQAQLSIARMYRLGKGVPQDYMQAHVWYNLAAASCSPPCAIRNLAVEHRDLIELKMTPEQIAEAQRLAREWKPK